MANNQYVNEVVYGNQVLISLVNDTITPSDLARGVTAHDASGAPITGTSAIGGAYVNGTTTYIPSSQGSVEGTTTTLY